MPSFLAPSCSISSVRVASVAPLSPGTSPAFTFTAPFAVADMLCAGLGCVTRLLVRVCFLLISWHQGPLALASPSRCGFFRGPGRAEMKSLEGVFQTTIHGCILFGEAASPAYGGRTNQIPKILKYPRFCNLQTKPSRVGRQRIHCSRRHCPTLTRLSQCPPKKSKTRRAAEAARARATTAAEAAAVATTAAPAGGELLFSKGRRRRLGSASVAKQLTLPPLSFPPCSCDNWNVGSYQAPCCLTCGHHCHNEVDVSAWKLLA